MATLNKLKFRIPHEGIPSYLSFQVPSGITEIIKILLDMHQRDTFSPQLRIRSKYTFCDESEMHTYYMLGSISQSDRICVSDLNPLCIPGVHLGIPSINPRFIGCHV